MLRKLAKNEWHKENINITDRQQSAPKSQDIILLLVHSLVHSNKTSEITKKKTV